VVRSYSGHTGQITSITLRPLQGGETWSRSNSPSISIRIATPAEHVERKEAEAQSPKKTSPLSGPEKADTAASTGNSAHDAETVNATEPFPLSAVKVETDTNDADKGAAASKEDADDDSLFGDEMDVEKNLDEALGLGASQSMNLGMDMTMNDGELGIPLQTSKKKRQAEDSDDGDSLFGGDAASGDGSPIDANTAPEMQPDADAEGEDDDAEGEDDDAEGEDDDAEGEDDDQPLAALVANSRTPNMPSGIGLPGAGLSRQNTNHDSPLTLPNGHTDAVLSASTAASASATRSLPKPAFGGRSAIASFDGDVSRFSNDIMLTSTLGGQVTLWDRRVPSYPGSGAASNPSNGQASHKGVRALALPAKTPPWCTSACWNSRGDKIYVGRRNETIDEWDLRMLPDTTDNGSAAGLGPKSNARFARSLRMPAGSGPITSVLGMPNGRHLVCGSYDNVRIWDTLAHPSNTTSVPFRIVAGHHGAVVSDILLDPTARFLFTASGDRGWMSNSTESVILHEVRSL
jgi:transcriptional activator SPT8